MSEFPELDDMRTDEDRDRQAAGEIRGEEIRYGHHWSTDERNLRIEQRILELEALDRLVENSVALHRMQLEAEFNDRDLAAARHQELIDTVERGNVVAKVVDVAVAHPFLAGFFGSLFLNRARRR